MRELVLRGSQGAYKSALAPSTLGACDVRELAVMYSEYASSRLGAIGRTEVVGESRVCPVFQGKRGYRQSLQRLDMVCC